MVKYISGDIAYYFSEQKHLDQALKMSSSWSSVYLMNMANFAVDRKTNTIVID